MFCVVFAKKWCETSCFAAYGLAIDGGWSTGSVQTALCYTGPVFLLLVGFDILFHFPLIAVMKKESASHAPPALLAGASEVCLLS